MKKRLTTLAVASVIGVLFLTHNAKMIEAPQAQEIVPIAEAIELETPQQLVIKYAEQYQVPAPLIKELIVLENSGLWDEKLQSECRYTRDHPEWGVKQGEQEKSYGLAQIHLPSHPTITYEQATNADFSIRFIASEISQGRGRQWSCYRTAQYNIANGKSGGKCTL